MANNATSMLKGLIQEAKPIGEHHIHKDATKIATIDEVLSERCEENCILVCVLCKLVHKDHDKQEDGANPYKKQKKGCNRIFQFGDGTGQTCCIISENQEHAKTLMNLVVGVAAVGECVVLIEPTVKAGHSCAKTCLCLKLMLLCCLCRHPHARVLGHCS
jgi:hypothetical protein